MMNDDEDFGAEENEMEAPKQTPAESFIPSQSQGREK